jgi:7-carboxy-7-deazaguanine synthase
MDLKTPGSGELDKNRLQNLECLGAGDQVKFVICDRRDYEWARQMLADHPMPKGCEALISPAYGIQEPSELAEWMLQDRLAARFQLQLHKILWGEERAR